MCAHADTKFLRSVGRLVGRSKFRPRYNVTATFGRKNTITNKNVSVCNNAVQASHLMICKYVFGVFSDSEIVAVLKINVGPRNPVPKNTAGLNMSSPQMG